MFKTHFVFFRLEFILETQDKGPFMVVEGKTQERRCEIKGSENVM